MTTQTFSLALLGLPVSSTIGDGLNLILQMRQLKPLLPIVVLVNQDTLGIGIQALEFGASAYFPWSHLSAQTLQQIIKNLTTQFQEIQNHHARDVALVNAMPIGVMVLDDAGVVTAVNDEWHHSRDETTDPIVTGVAVGADFLQLCQTANRHEVRHIIEQAAAGHSAKQAVEYQWKEVANPATVWRKITVAPMQWPRGKLVVSLQEVTDLVVHQIQQASFEAELLELKTNFSSLVHYFRSPLTSLHLYLDLLKVAKPAKKAQYLATMQQEVTHMNLLVDDLLTLTSLETSENYALALVDLASLVAEVVQVEQPIAAGKGLVLHFMPLPEAPIWVWGQSRQLTRVVTNLVGNALRYTAVGQITVQLRVDNAAKQVELMVADTGMGIAPEVLPFIFEPFFRSPRAQAFAPKGTGLGLAIVKRIITLHDGHIEIASELNKGTTVRLTLPLAGDTAVA
ncbi:MAG: hybrid sensor histidine kinase/response regulator [Chloroflexota bacterium]